MRRLLPYLLRIMKTIVLHVDLILRWSCPVICDSACLVPAPTKKIKLSGLQSKVDTEVPLGVIDPEAGIDGAIATLDNEPCDVMLVLVNPSQNMDKFYILQLVETDQDNFMVYSRWGRTGTTGQALHQDFDDFTSAEACFVKKFREKTGLEWDEREDSAVGGKYRFVKQDYTSKQAGFSGAKWQYWVDDGVDGKEDGWYDYDIKGSKQAERLFSEHSRNQNLTNRWVKSGAFTYDLDLVNMTQTNVVHANRKMRHIRRCPKNDQQEDQKNDPKDGTRAKTAISRSRKEAPNPAQTPSTPIRTSTKAAVVTPAALSDTSTSASSNRPPVDSDVTLYSRDPTEFEVVEFADNPDRYYDVVLNQCNITGGSNNNKYYRIQMIRDTLSGQFYVWQKWGRVGEPGRKSSSALQGPFKNEENALREYSKKFKSKTGNDYDTENFVSKSGKYTLIEIDNNVQVAGSVATPTVQYEESKLDSKTKELVQVLFSKDMRNEVCTNFNLDLKRLPLGVPSQQQIELGISTLRKIENKLGGSNTAVSFEELSSEFYTAIPHSFGRSRPPPINTSDTLQLRYDMCNILLDMYSTNETIRRLEEDDDKSANKTVHANPVDRHYSSLHTDLTLLDSTSSEYGMITEYFQKTRGQHRSSHLLNIWQVNRHSEGQRFQQFDKLDNRRLLWHGTNIAVVAPILTSGLRIMPHSGGRVGTGIYLAAMQEKSAQYTSGYQAKFACMFLCEAAMGKMHTITSDGPHASSLKKAPNGFDSVHAIGKLTPKDWGPLQIDDKQVSVPIDKAEQQDVETSFHHDEFLCYNEAQVRLRYIITVRL